MEPMFEISDGVNTILHEISTPELKRKDIAQTYALILRSSRSQETDWGTINRAIVKRWSKSGLIWIKNAALRGTCWKEPVQP